MRIFLWPYGAVRCTANDTEGYYEALITNENASHSHRLINSFRPQCDGEKVFNYSTHGV